MQFLAPLFLAALAGLAIPVLLHLTQREKKQIIRFPSLMFVRRIPYQSVRRRKIHNWLLLFVRLAVLTLLVLAFARPLISRVDAVMPSGEGARELVVLLDTSYSMGYGDRWAQAQQAVTQAVNGLNASDRASLVLFSSGAEILVRSSPEKEKLAAAITTARPGAGATRYGPALKVAGSILADSRLPRREALLISDFQRGGWRGEEGARLPQGAVLTPSPVETTAERPNVGVTGVTFARTASSNQERVAITAGVVNRTDRPVANLTVRLDVGTAANLIPAGNRQVTLEPNGAASVTFEPVTLTQANMRGVVRVDDDALAADNSYYFVLSPTAPLRVTVLDRGAAEPRRYLSDALAVGEEPRFETVVRQPEALTDEDLRRSAVVLVNDTPVPGTVARRLLRFVEGGGGLLIAAGDRASWPGEVDLLPATLGNPVDRTRGEAARVATIEYGHAVFEPFRGPRGGNFASALVYGYRNVTPGKDAQVLARFDPGSPALVERRLGTGRVLLWASSLTRAASDLPLKPVFPVFIQQSMRYLAAYREPQPWLTVGEVLDPAVAAQRAGGTARMVLSPAGARLPLDDEGADVLELTEQGFYEVRGAAGEGASGMTVIASNVDPAEGDLTPIDPRDIALAASGAPGESAGSGEVRLTPEAQENRQRLWWYLLCGGVLLLGLEAVLANRTAKT